MGEETGEREMTGMIGDFSLKRLVGLVDVPDLRPDTGFARVYRVYCVKTVPEGVGILSTWGSSIKE